MAKITKYKLDDDISYKIFFNCKTFKKKFCTCLSFATAMFDDYFILFTDKS